MRERFTVDVIRGAESWQFFAFVFAALLVLVYGLIDEIKSRFWRIVLKITSFIIVGYFTLINQTCRMLLISLLDWFKIESH